MECQKKMMMEHHKMSVSRKKKPKKEGEINNKNTLGEAVVVAATEEKRRYDASNNNYSSSIEANMLTCDDQQDREDWRVWLKPGMLVDEQMSWGSIWFSFWDVDANCNSDAFYSDVMEDDIWDLKSIKHTPQ
uniref:Uncharacterized protein n=1 Tax=Chenopodium quinoa TaxID=63459 RepID=A0A803MTZ6_CHEQI